MSRMTSLATAAAVAGLAAVAGTGIYFLRRWYARRTLYCLNVTLYVKPERRAEFLQCIKNNKAGTLSNEPLAVTYCYGEDTKEPNTFHFHEQYIGREGFEAHTKALHFAAWEKFASSDPFSAPPVVKFWTAPLALAAAATGDETRSSHPRAAAVSCLNARLVVKPERRADFLKAIGDDAAATLRDEHVVCRSNPRRPTTAAAASRQCRIPLTLRASICTTGRLRSASSSARTRAPRTCSICTSNTGCKRASRRTERRRTLRSGPSSSRRSLLRRSCG
jgi:quinol monooxygenase YgiN